MSLSRRAEWTPVHRRACRSTWRTRTEQKLLRRRHRGGHHRRARVAPRAAGHLAQLHAALPRRRRRRARGRPRASASRTRSPARVRQHAAHGCASSVELAETTRGAVVWASHFDGISGRPVRAAGPDRRPASSTRSPRTFARRSSGERCASARRAWRPTTASCGRWRSSIASNEEDFTEARAWLEKAIVLDPGYAAPYAWLAIWHSIRVGQGWSRRSGPGAGRSPPARRPPPSSATASTRWRWRWPGTCESILRYEFDEAMALFDRALEASPNNFARVGAEQPDVQLRGQPPRGDPSRRSRPCGCRRSIPTIFLPHTALVPRPLRRR